MTRPAYNSRIFLTGKTRSGKSALARLLFLSAAAPRLVIDPADSTLTAIRGAVTFTDPGRATNARGERWTTAATARFVPRDPDDLEAYARVYAWAFAHYPRMVWADEAGSIMPAAGTLPPVRRYLAQGAKRQLGHIGLHTRPREVTRGLIAQASHVGIFTLPASEDRAYLAGIVGLPVALLTQQLDALEPFGFLWYDVGAATLTPCAPLPPPAPHRPELAPTHEPEPAGTVEDPETKTDE